MSSKTQFAHRSRKLSCLAASALASAAMLAAIASPAQAFTSTHVSGYHGYWQGSEGTNICSRGDVTTLLPHVSGAPAYSRSYQTISMIPRLDYSPDGTNWYTKKYGSWQQATVYGTRTVRFNSATLKVPSRGYWRVAMDFRWHVGGREVGRVVNVFNAGPAGWGEYSADGYTAYVANTSSAHFCLFN